ncbi:unnamed protein product [Rotaria sp. Silwood1]|nr:unnamed protein product [Rotaria sp. Silwood1]CAF3598630.1 unnamed protein product [Rotaria sp. Silwood1]CAF3882318.1 unnamed protein product [Rotaria sp. Silwood1]
MCCSGGVGLAASAEFYSETNSRLLEKLQSDIQTIAVDEIITIDQIISTKWTIEKLDNRASSKIFRLTIVFRLQQQRAALTTVPFVHESIDGRSIRLYPPAETSTAFVVLPDLEQVTTPLDNEQYSQYVITPATPPPPSYYKVINSFSQGIFSDCPKCNNQKCVFNANYCTQCGYSLLTVTDSPFTHLSL